ncbi:ribonuclease E inhibitor RraB [Nibricoccus aquaticus]|nr:ribonuclease E inhibitor RraB [Nibricoccus aquaticus]
MAKKVQIGAIIEIDTKIGKAYAQFSHYHSEPPRWGALIRVLPGVFDERPAEFKALVVQKEIFSTFFPLQAAVNRDIVREVGAEPLPEHAKPFPLFRSGNPNPETGKVSQWWLWDGVKSWMVPGLTDEQWDLPIKEISNDLALIDRIETGWTPRKDEAMTQEERAKNPVQKRITKTRHFLLFKTRADAECVLQEVADRGMMSGGILDDGSGFTLLVEQLGNPSREDLDRVMATLREIAALRNGHYDGWDTAVAG